MIPDSHILLKPKRFRRNTGKYIVNYSHGDKKGIMMICLILTSHLNILRTLPLYPLSRREGEIFSCSLPLIILATHSC
jgi:hypothetical protein